MKLSEFIEKYGDTEVEFKDGNLSIVAPFPSKGDEYFRIDVDGSVEPETWDGRLFDVNALDIGNVFEFEKDAKDMVERLKIRKELIDLGAFEPWMDSDDPLNGVAIRRYVSIDDEDIVSYFISLTGKDAFGLYFKTAEQAENAIRKIGKERILKYLFGVENV